MGGCGRKWEDVGERGRTWEEVGGCGRQFTFKIIGGNLSATIAGQHIEYYKSYVDRKLSTFNILRSGIECEDYHCISIEHQHQWTEVKIILL